MKYLLLPLLCATVSICNSQNSLIPGDIAYEKSKLKKGKIEMGYFIINGGRKEEIGTFKVDILHDSKTLSIYTTLQLFNSNDLWVDTCISDGKTFKPIYRSSFNKDNEYVLRFTNEVKGYYFNKQAQNVSKIQQPLKDSFFESSSYPYLLGLLPISTGYKKDMTVFDYKPGQVNNIKKAYITEVRNSTYVSDLTGEYKVWKVSVFEDWTGDSYEYYIDKSTSRIWKIEILSKGKSVALIDKETDFDPFVNKFDKGNTLRLITDGSAVIIGQAFARDNKNGGALQGMAILNVNKKQYAAKGTVVILMPYTSFFKEWLKFNEGRQKKFMPLKPLPPGANECIVETKVYDDEGHFEFLNLMPGDYLLTIKFVYAHSASETEVIGYSDTYVNGIYQGSNDITTTNHFVADANANVKKIITIKKEGEKVSVKLKKTL